MHTPPVAPPVPTRLLPGKALAEQLLAQVRSHAAVAPVPPALAPSLAIVLVGAHPASQVYVARKQAACAAVGLACQLVQLPAAAGEARLHTTLRALGQSPDTTGIILQLPLPAGFNTAAALACIPPAKDVDGLTPTNQASRHIWPATPLGVLRLLDHYNVPLAGTPVCVVGRSALVGAPLAELLTRHGAVVRTVAKDTPAPRTLTRAASLVCVAAGVPGLVDASWITPGAVLIDIGLTRTPQGLRGDVQTEGPASVLGVAGALTPVPGGVGPLTVASLLTNVVDAAYLQAGRAAPSWQVRA